MALPGKYTKTVLKNPQNLEKNSIQSLHGTMSFLFLRGGGRVGIIKCQGFVILMKTYLEIETFKTDGKTKLIM